MFKSVPGLLASALLLVGICGFASIVAAADVTISGKVSYTEKVSLPAAANLRVELVELSSPQPAVRLGAQAPIGEHGHIPLMFSLRFDDQLLRPGQRYGLVAEIAAGGAVYFRNTTPYVIDMGVPAPDLTIIVQLLEPPERQQPSREPDAVSPVEPADLDDGPLPSAGLLDTVWRAEVIGGTPSMPEVRTTLSFAEDGRVGGKAGCNSYFAETSIDGSVIEFGGIAATRLACPEPAMSQEIAYFAALGAVKSYLVNEEGLTFFDSDGETVIRFARSQ